MTSSLVYLLLRQVLQMLTQLARDDGAKTSNSWSSAIRWRCYAGRYTAPISPVGVVD